MYRHIDISGIKFCELAQKIVQYFSNICDAQNNIL